MKPLVGGWKEGENVQRDSTSHLNFFNSIIPPTIGWSKPLGMVFKTSQTGLQLRSHIKSTHCLRTLFQPSSNAWLPNLLSPQPHFSLFLFLLHGICFTTSFQPSTYKFNSKVTLLSLKYHLTLVRMANIKMSVNNMLEKVWKKGMLRYCW